MSDRSAKNRLADEASPYLQQHGSNPVDWYPWGDEALLRAKREDKPIFLSIGYSACHWCHVMERESFEDETTARVLNEGFVAIKVDREERPDLDQIYQLVVQLMGRSGGWPLSVFLTPDKKPFFGGTYFPPVERYGMPSFTQVLAALSDAYKERRGEVSDQADEITKAITRALSDDGAKGDRDASKDSARLGPDLLARVAKRLGARFDGKNGGFGSRPKFPNTMSLDVLLRRGAQENDVLAIAQVTMALDAMRAGGIHDHVGGGFHRYSTDERWLVPHFEKMLYDNSLLLRLYVDAARACEGTERHREVARSIAEYVAREMTSPEGGFYASQDADSEGEEGKFFVWSPDEVREVLGKDDVAMRAALLRFGVTDEGNFEETKKSVLYEAKTMREVADALGVSEEDAEVAISRAKKALFEAREKREKPFRDEKILVSWNGMMIGAMAAAGAALADDAMIARAARAFDHVERALVSGEGDALTIARLAKGDRVRGPGFLDDYALLADAALDLYEATGDARYALRAREVARAMLSRFHAKGDFFYTPHDGEALIVRAKDAYDNAVPSGASVAMRVLLRLGTLADESMETIARESLERAGSSAIETPSGYGHTLGSLDRLVRGSVDVVLVGARTDPRTRALARVVHERYLPNRTLAWLDPTDARSREACARLAEGKRAEGAPVAYVCRGRTCSSPVDTAFALQALLAEGA